MTSLGNAITGITLCLLSAASMPTFASGTIQPLIDDFSHQTHNSFGLERQFINDSTVGGGTHTRLAVEQGKLSVTGEIVPPRGQPGWASTVLLLDSMGQPVDLRHYQGVHLRVKVNSGNLSVSANSTEIDNFDYHAAMVVATNDGEFHDVKIPFETMKRAWSEQTDLNTATINSLSIVAFSLQQASFDYVIDQVSFY